MTALGILTGLLLSAIVALVLALTGILARRECDGRYDYDDDRNL